jgi:hypothetical protein
VGARRWVGVCGRVVGCVGVVCVGVSGGGGGRFPLALEHSKVCTLCDFGHLQFICTAYDRAPASEVAGGHTLPFYKWHGLPILKWYSTSEAGIMSAKVVSCANINGYLRNYQDCLTIVLV